MDARPQPRSHWKRLVDESERDGIGPVAKRHGLNRRTLAWWRWRLSSEPKSSKAVAPRLLPVHVMSTATQEREVIPIEIAVDGVRVRVAVGTDVDYVARVVASLRTQCSP